MEIRKGMKIISGVMMMAVLSAALMVRAGNCAVSDYLSVSGDYSIYTSYVWRGFELDEDPVIQTGLNIGYKCITLSIWNSQDMVYNDAVNSAEVDFVVDITRSFDSLSISLGNTSYTFPKHIMFLKHKLKCA